jgi:hypothetical protein
MSRSRVLLLTALAMLAFAATHSCAVSLSPGTSIDAGTFTTVRIVSGALTLWIIVHVRSGARRARRQLAFGCALFAYAAGFSLAYINLSAATGALLLFGAVQATMIGYSFWNGDRLRGLQLVGFVCAVLGLVALLLPGLTAPPLHSAALMVGAGIAWGIYSLRGRGAGDPTSATAGNFVRAVPFAAALSLRNALEVFSRRCRSELCNCVGSIDVGSRLRHLVHGAEGLESDERGDGAAKRAGDRDDRRRAAIGRARNDQNRDRLGCDSRRHRVGDSEQSKIVELSHDSPFGAAELVGRAVRNCRARGRRRAGRSRSRSMICRAAATAGPAIWQACVQ